jgi:hypothetical protein
MIPIERIEKIPYILALFAAFIVTLSRSFRWPNDWAEAHWLISYQFGFIKRGLPGTLVFPLTNGADSELVIRWVSTVVLFFLCVALFWICIRTMTRSQYSLVSVMISLVFLTSSFVVMSAHTNGYFDHLIILITIGSCWLVLHDKVILATALISAGLLVHESIFIIGYPTLVFTVLISQPGLQSEANVGRLAKDLISRTGILLLVPFILLLLMVAYQTNLLDSEDVGMQVAKHLESHEYIEETRHVFVAYALTASFPKQLENQSQHFVQRVFNVEFLIVVMIPVFLIITMSLRLTKCLRFGPLIRALMVAIPLIPLFLHAVAWDTSRIWTYPLVVSMLVYWVSSERFESPPQGGPMESLVSVVAGLVLVLQIFPITELMDDAVERFTIPTRLLLYSPPLLLIASAAALSARGAHTGGSAQP